METGTPKKLRLGFWLVCFGILTLGQMKSAGASEAGSFEVNLKKDKVTLAQKHRDALHELKQAEQNGKVAECRRLVDYVWKEVGLIRPWLALSYFQCLNSEKVLKLDQNWKAHEAQLLRILNSSELDIIGPWSRNLGLEKRKFLRSWIELRLNRIEGPPSKLTELIGFYSDGGESTSREEMARVYFWLGQLEESANSFSSARELYEFSLSESENAEVRTRIEGLQRKSGALLAEVTPSVAMAKDSAKGSGFDPSRAEGEFKDRLSSSLAIGDQLNLLEDIVQYLNRYPGGLVSKWASDKGIEVLLSLRMDAAIEARVSQSISRLDPNRALDWARVVHRRGDWFLSKLLAERNLTALPDSVQAGMARYVAGRSSQFLGNIESCKLHFEKFVEQNQGSEDLGEVLFRLGLCYLRKKEFGSAIAVFERTTTASGGSKYELWSKYWLVRALQATANPRHEVERTALIEKWPFSYYGILLRGELEKNKWKFPLFASLTADTTMQDKSNNIESFRLPAVHVTAWKRFSILSAAGWSWQALAEIQEIPVPPAAAGKAILAKKISEKEMHPHVIRLINQSGDQDPVFRNQDWVKLSFPKVYPEIIETRSREYKLHPQLVWSLIRQESAFHPRAVSTSNAMGLMQLIPPTAREMLNELKLQRLDVSKDIFIPEINVRLGVHYLAKLLNQFEGNVAMALAGYNAGPHRLKTFFEGRTKVPIEEGMMRELWIDELPWFETSFYVKAILRNAIMYRALDEGQVDLTDPVWKGLYNSASVAKNSSD